MSPWPRRVAPSTSASCPSSFAGGAEETPPTTDEPADSADEPDTTPETSSEDDDGGLSVGVFVLIGLVVVVAGVGVFVLVRRRELTASDARPMPSGVGQRRPTPGCGRPAPRDGGALMRGIRAFCWPPV